mmetsp:Transcript_27519/g.38877  ORF Transcript_27519/g.38877 Transcript_27519/m.38877 type:complete len:105 (+) Transcript_27519:425-739(+)
MCVQERVMGSCDELYNPMQSVGVDVGMDEDMEDSDVSVEDCNVSVDGTDDPTNNPTINTDREFVMMNHMAERFAMLRDDKEHYRLRDALISFVHTNKLHYKNNY